jgi:hypothetical protein
VAATRLGRWLEWSAPLRRTLRSRESLRRVALVIGGGLLAAQGARAVDLPEDKAEGLIHVYKGGGVTASGPALLVRKSVADKVSLSAGFYVDQVSNASIDVVTTASPYRETRTSYDFGADYTYRDTLMSLSLSHSKEPDYTANAFGIDVSQEVFGGMTTVSMGFTRGSDSVLKKYSPEFADAVTHWQYRFGLTQVLTPKWIAAANFEAISDDGFLGSPYRAARVFGAIVPERNPRTRSSRAIKFRVNGDLGSSNAMHAEYRYFWDNWAIKSHTLEGGYSRYFGEKWLADATLRYYKQSKALFYSDNAQSETLYVSRNRQLGTFNSVGLGAKLSYQWKKVPGKYEIKANGAWELVQFRYKDFTDLRTGSLYSFNANVVQVYLSATY